MEESKNSSQLDDQLKKLLSQLKDTEQNEIAIDIKLQIYSFKETERDSKKVYVMTLCDNKYKFGSFFLAMMEGEQPVEKGKIIHLKEVSPKIIKNNLYIRIKKYEILDESIEIEDAKDIKEVNGIFKDEEGNDIFAKKEENEEKPKSLDIKMNEDNNRCLYIFKTTNYF